MNRKFIMVLTLVFAIAFAFGAQAEPTDPIGMVKLRAGEPVHIAYWVVISGPNVSLGTDVVPPAVPKAARPLPPNWQPTRPLWEPSARPARVQPNPVCPFCGKPVFHQYRPQTRLRS